METITISGGFHNARPISIRARRIDSKLAVSAGQLRKILTHMCGVKGCTCGIRNGWSVDGAPLDEVARAINEAQIDVEYQRYSNRK